MSILVILFFNCFDFEAEWFHRDLTDEKFRPSLFFRSIIYGSKRDCYCLPIILLSDFFSIHTLRLLSIKIGRIIWYAGGWTYCLELPWRRTMIHHPTSNWVAVNKRENIVVETLSFFLIGWKVRRRQTAAAVQLTFDFCYSQWVRPCKGLIRKRCWCRRKLLVLVRFSWGRSQSAHAGFQAHHGFYLAIYWAAKQEKE